MLNALAPPRHPLDNSSHPGSGEHRSRYSEHHRRRVTRVCARWQHHHDGRDDMHL